MNNEREGVIETIKTLISMAIAFTVVVMAIYAIFCVIFDPYGEDSYEKVCINGSVYLRKDGMLVEDGYARHCIPLSEFKEGE